MNASHDGIPDGALFLVAQFNTTLLYIDSCHDAIYAALHHVVYYTPVSFVIPLFVSLVLMLAQLCWLAWFLIVCDTAVVEEAPHLALQLVLLWMLQKFRRRCFAKSEHSSWPCDDWPSACRHAWQAGEDASLYAHSCLCQQQSAGGQLYAA